LALKAPLLAQFRRRFETSLDPIRQCRKQFFAAWTMHVLDLMTFDGQEIASAALASVLAKCTYFHNHSPWFWWVENLAMRYFPPTRTVSGVIL
jgi:hypothetical protein